MDNARKTRYSKIEEIMKQEQDEEINETTTTKQSTKTRR